MKGPVKINMKSYSGPYQSYVQQCKYLQSPSSYSLSDNKNTTLTLDTVFFVFLTTLIINIFC